MATGERPTDQEAGNLRAGIRTGRGSLLDVACRRGSAHLGGTAAPPRRGLGSRGRFCYRGPLAPPAQGTGLSRLGLLLGAYRRRKFSADIPISLAVVWYPYVF